MQKRCVNSLVHEEISYLYANFAKNALVSGKNILLDRRSWQISSLMSTNKNIWPGWGIYWTLDLRGQMARKVFKITNKNIKYRIDIKYQISINNKYLTWMMFILKAGPQRADGAENSQYCWDVLTSEALTCFNSNLDSNPMLEICNVLFLFRLSNSWDLNCLQNM